MFGFGLLELLVVAGLVLVAVVVLVLVVTLTVGPGRRPSPPRDAPEVPDTLLRARRHGRVATVVAGAVLVLVVVGAVALMTAGSKVAVVASPLAAGAVAGTGPLLASAAALLVLLVGERSWPRPQGDTRTALLRRRRVAALWRGRRARVTGVLLALLIGVAVTCLLLADGTGRGITLSTTEGGLPVTRGAGPFPGAYYVLPQLAVLLVAVALLVAVLRAATQRPAVQGVDAGVDDALRRVSAARALRLLQVGLLLTLAGDLGTGLSAYGRVHSGATPAWTLLAVVLAVLCLGGAVATLAAPTSEATAAAEPVHV